MDAWTYKRFINPENSLQNSFFEIDPPDNVTLPSGFKEVLKCLNYALTPEGTLKTAGRNLALYGAGVGLTAAGMIHLRDRWRREQQRKLEKEFGTDIPARPDGAKQVDAGDSQTGGTRT